MNEIPATENNNVKYINDIEKREFIKIYEEEILRLNNKVEALLASVDQKTFEIAKLKQEKEKTHHFSETNASTEQLKKENEAYKVKIQSLIKEKEQLSLDANDELRQKCITEKSELAELLLETRIHSKYLIEQAEKNAEQIKTAAYQEIAATKENTKMMNEKLEKLKIKSDQVVTDLMKDFDNLLK